MLVPFSWVSNMGYEKETETGYEKAVKVAGFPGLEKWNTESKDGELTLVASKRYIVELEGDRIDDPKVLQHAGRVDVDRKLPSSTAVRRLPAGAPRPRTGLSDRRRRRAAGLKTGHVTSVCQEQIRVSFHAASRTTGRRTR